MEREISDVDTFSCQCCHEPYETEYRIHSTTGDVDLYQNFCEECDGLYYDDSEGFDLKYKEGSDKQKLKIRNIRINKILSNE
jgi:hypothetical protein